MERKPKSTCWSRLSRVAAFALFCLFAAPAAQAMLLELHFQWTPAEITANHLQTGSIVQVIAYNSENPKATDQYIPDNVSSQFGKPYGTTSDETTHAQAGGEVPGEKEVYLADSTHAGHDILYTGSIQNSGSTYDFYTQLYIDRQVYDTVYIRVFGANSLGDGELIASYWDVSDEIHLELNPPYQFQSYSTNGMTVDPEHANYFEVIPEPATLGLLGLGGCALAAWRRRRPQEDDR